MVGKPGGVMAPSDSGAMGTGSFVAVIFAKIQKFKDICMPGF